MNLYGERDKMTRNKVPVPRFYFDIDRFKIGAIFQDNKEQKKLQLNLQISLRQVKLVDSFALKNMRNDASRVANSDFEMDFDDSSSSFSRVPPQSMVRNSMASDTRKMGMSMSSKVLQPKQNYDLR